MIKQIYSKNEIFIDDLTDGNFCIIQCGCLGAHCGCNRIE